MIETTVPLRVVTGSLVLKQPNGVTEVTIEIPLDALAKLDNRSICERYLAPACYAALTNLRGQLK